MNTFGELFRVTTFGESHGGAVGVVIDGVPAGFDLDLTLVQNFLNRRRPGQSHLSSPRDEKDQVQCLSGLSHGKTLGTPLTLIVHNEDFKPEHYSDMTQVFRPSHGDYTTFAKWGIRAPSGGGRSSARETIGRVAAAAVAEQLLAAHLPKLRVVAYVDRVKDVSAQITDPEKISRQEVDAHPLRCPDKKHRDAMEAVIVAAKKKGDTVGGTIFCYISGCPVGLGAPVFDKLEADLAKAMMSLPASKGFEVGSGFAGTQLYGSEHNDAFVQSDQGVKTATNRSGGIQGGISNGETIYFRVAFKPVSTIFQTQRTVNDLGQEVDFKPQGGRHDPCVLPRAVPMVESMALLVVMDHYLRQVVITHTRKNQPQL